MSEASRERLATIVRDPACDLAEAALLCCVEAQPDLDVDVALARVDALADELATGLQPHSRYEPLGWGATIEAATADAQALSGYLSVDLGFTGDPAAAHDPRNALLTSVLERRRGTRTALGVIYIAVGRRVGLRVFPLATPGPLLVGVGGGAPEGRATRPAVVDPFEDGVILDDEMIAERVEAATDGHAEFARSMLRPAPATSVVRRLINELTHAYLHHGDARGALWTVEVRRLLPGLGPDDVLVTGQLLAQLGRYRQSAEVLEGYLTEVAGDVDTAAEAGGPELATMAAVARAARAKMN
ncbi:MAG: transglutaminase-like domain-containing protein [Actinomycetota bacterium]|nr:transglutaminase-like domain-containing protein [Actinomycetota bacterium]